MPRGPKPKTAKNSPSSLAVLSKPEPTSKLEAVAQKEFERLVAHLYNRGTLERIDVSVITECARIKEMLDIAFTLNDDKMIGKLMLHRRGLLREMGLTIQPSRSLVKSIAKNEESADPIQGKIKLHG